MSDQQINCSGCPDGCPDEIEKDCDMCEPVEFCCTLKIPAGFSIPADDPEEYIEENFDVAAYFVDGCFDCDPQQCTINPDQIEGINCGPITVIQTVIQGTIKVIGGFCVASDNALETGSQAPVCCESLVCVDIPTPVCIGCNANCAALRVIGADNVDAELLDASCEEFGGNGDEIWEVTGELVFACEPVDGNGDDGNGDLECDCTVSGALNIPGANQPRLQFTPAVCRNCNLDDSRFQYRDRGEEVELDIGPGSGEITDVDCEVLASGVIQATITGTAPAIIGGEEFDDCEFTLVITDIETLEIEIDCGEEEYTRTITEEESEGNVRIEFCS